MRLTNWLITQFLIGRIEYSICVLQGLKSAVPNEHILCFMLLDPRMVDSSILFTKYVSEWATDLRAISLNVGVTTFGPPCINQQILYSGKIHSLVHSNPVLRINQI